MAVTGVWIGWLGFYGFAGFLVGTWWVVFCFCFVLFFCFLFFFFLGFRFWGDLVGQRVVVGMLAGTKWVIINKK